MFAEAVKRLTRSVCPILGTKTDGNDPAAIEDCRSLGTGFFISDFGTLVTAAHVVDYAVKKGLTHKYASKDWLGTIVNQGQDDQGLLIHPEFKWVLTVCEDRAIDVCVLQIMENVNTQPIHFLGRLASTGEQVGAIGFPLADHFPGKLATYLRFFGGYICSLGDRTLMKNTRECFVYETDIMFLPGISGGPVIVPSGELIGVIHGTRTLDKALVTLSLVVSGHELGKLITESLATAGRKVLGEIRAPSVRANGIWIC